MPWNYISSAVVQLAAGRLILFFPDRLLFGFCDLFGLFDHLHLIFARLLQYRFEILAAQSLKRALALLGLVGVCFFIEGHLVLLSLILIITIFIYKIVQA